METTKRKCGYGPPNVMKNFQSGLWKQDHFSAYQDTAAGYVHGKGGNSSVANGHVCRNDRFGGVGAKSFRAGVKSTASANTRGESSAMRRKVMEALELFHEELAKLKNENVRNPNREKKAANQLPQAAAMCLKRQGKWLSISKRLEEVPGVEVGDTFQYRAELCVVGLHCQFSSGIDYLKDHGIVATSIVDSGRYDNKVISDDKFIYMGHGENPSIRSKPRLHDQKLERGNQALINSMNRNSPVRVIRREKSLFRYDGLFSVENYELVRGKYGKMVFKFTLRRIGGNYSN